MNTNIVSECCKTSLKVSGNEDGEGTFFYVCTKCNNPADIYTGGKIHAMKTTGCKHEYFTNEYDQEECKHCTLLKSTIDYIQDDPKMVGKPISEESWEKEFDAIGFGNQAIVNASYSWKRQELKSFIASQIANAHAEGVREGKKAMRDKLAEKEKEE